MLRLFRFKTNIISEKKNSLSAEYNAIGHFDGLSMRVYTNPEDYTLFFYAEPIKELYNFYDMLGIRNESDDKFWEKGDEPYIFITCLRFKRRTRNIYEVIYKIESNYHAICYLSLDSMDLIVCLRTGSYLFGYVMAMQYQKIIEEYDVGNTLQVSFSSVVIWQETLDGLANETKISQEAKKEIERLKHEKVSVFLRSNVKSWRKYDDYRKKIEETFGESYVRDFYTLGSEDAVIELENVDSHDLLKLYAKNGLLTHSNDDYKSGIYNLHTEIFFDDPGILKEVRRRL